MALNGFKFGRGSVIEVLVNKTQFSQTMLLLLVALLMSCSEQVSRIAVQVDSITAHVELADTEETRSRGLMYREKLGRDEGMLIAYSKPQPISLWMLNTPLPLDVGFFDANGRLFQITQMMPDGGKTTHHSIQPGQYALEMNQGWFERHGIKIGAKLKSSELAL